MAISCKSSRCFPPFKTKQHSFWKYAKFQASFFRTNLHLLFQGGWVAFNQNGWRSIRLKQGENGWRLDRQRQDWRLDHQRYWWTKKIYITHRVHGTDKFSYMFFLIFMKNVTVHIPYIHGSTMGYRKWNARPNGQVSTYTTIGKTWTNHENNINKPHPPTSSW